MRSMALKTAALAVLLPFLVAGCAEMSPTLKGGLVGAGVCGAAGAAAGAVVGEPGKGAAVGAIGCGIVGLALGEMYSQNKQAEANTQRPPSESYSTILTPPSPKLKSEPLLLVNGANGSDAALAGDTMSLMMEILASRGIIFENYTLDSVIQYPNSPIVVLISVRKLVPPSGYEVVLILISKTGERKDYTGVAPTRSQALSQALFGK